MKLKRVALVAAAAVAGPTVLMSSPAMADDKQPAVVVPDTAPKEDNATPDAKPAKPEAKPAPKAESKAETPDKEEFDSSHEGLLMGPEIEVQGIPKAGFKPGGDWTRLTVQVDNTGHVAVPKFTPSLAVMQWDDKFKASHVKVERLVKDASGNRVWTPVQAVRAEEYGPALLYPLGTTASVAKNQVYGVDVRIRFTADVPVELFEISADGVSRSGGKVNHSPSAWYETRIVGAKGDTQGPTVVQGPKLTVNGVPEGIVAGDNAWTNLSVRVDNTGKQALKRFDAGLVIARPDWVPMKASQLTVEVYSADKQGRKGWHRAEIRDESEGYFLGIDLAGGPVPAGKSFEVKIRVKFSAKAKPGDLVFRAFGFAEGDPEGNTWVESRSKGVLSKLLKAGTNTGNTGNTDNGNGNGGKDTDPQTPAPTPTPTPTPTPAPNDPAPQGGNNGELAATGADPATSWALAGAGVAVALGVALVAGTGRRRRTTA
ncbi:hypothetical protein [Streptomyces sp. NPDC002054]|uniref:hypothetical protein n=1 Tax=Streptomyces sp. NPDC002054 TaxID=3154663 RepID=UPI00331BB157